MKKLLVLILSVVMAMTMGSFAFAEEAAADDSPVIGSWILDQVYLIGEEPELLNKEEAQSVYGSGLTVFTFDDGGYAHEITFDAGDMIDLGAEWTSEEPGIIEFTDDDSIQMTFCYNEEEDTLHRSFKDESPDAMYPELDFVYARAITGAWQLSQVLEIHEGDAPDELPAEENQSLYGNAKNVYLFCADGTAQVIVADGPDKFTVDAAWEMTNPDEFTCTSEDGEMVFNYFRVDDTIFEDIKSDDPNAEHPFLRFIYARTEYTPDAE